jgi:hypothetical protein
MIGEKGGTMTEESRMTPYNVRYVLLVNKYASPLAVFLVCLGVMFCRPEGIVRLVSVALALFGYVFNMFYRYFIKNQSVVKPWVVNSRLGINLAVDVVLVYLLGEYWPPMWLLLALAPVATAIYGTRTRTAIVSTGVSLLLLGIQAVRPSASAAQWAQQICYGLFIVFLSLMVNELAQWAKGNL